MQIKVFQNGSTVLKEVHLVNAFECSEKVLILELPFIIF